MDSGLHSVWSWCGAMQLLLRPSVKDADSKRPDKPYLNKKAPDVPGPPQKRSRLVAGTQPEPTPPSVALTPDVAGLAAHLPTHEHVQALDLRPV